MSRQLDQQISMTMIYLFKKLLGLETDPTNYTILELDYDDGDAQISFAVEKVKYLLDLEWEDGTMFIEYSEMDDEANLCDTTNYFHQYELLMRIHDITHEIAKKVTRENGVKFLGVTFESSDIRGGELDPESKKIRDKFFLRYVSKDFPKCKVIEKDGKVFVKLYG